MDLLERYRDCSWQFLAEEGEDEVAEGEDEVAEEGEGVAVEEGEGVTVEEDVAEVG